MVPSTTVNFSNYVLRDFDVTSYSVFSTSVDSTTFNSTASSVTIATTVSTVTFSASTYTTYLATDGIYTFSSSSTPEPPNTSTYISYYPSTSYTTVTHDTSTVQYDIPWVIIAGDYSSGVATTYSAIGNGSSSLEEGLFSAYFSDWVNFAYSNILQYVFDSSVSISTKFFSTTVSDLGGTYSMAAVLSIPIGYISADYPTTINTDTTFTTIIGTRFAFQSDTSYTGYFSSVAPSAFTQIETVRGTDPSASSSCVLRPRYTTTLASETEIFWSDTTTSSRKVTIILSSDQDAFLYPKTGALTYAGATWPDIYGYYLTAIGVCPSMTFGTSSQEKSSSDSTFISFHSVYPNIVSPVLWPDTSIVNRVTESAFSPTHIDYTTTSSSLSSGLVIHFSIPSSTELAVDSVTDASRPTLSRSFAYDDQNRGYYQNGVYYAYQSFWGLNQLGLLVLPGENSWSLTFTKGFYAWTINDVSTHSTDSTRVESVSSLTITLSAGQNMVISCLPYVLNTDTKSYLVNLGYTVTVP
jgi:hypothetical protein